MKGRVNRHCEATMRVHVRGHQRQTRRLTAIVDTGFSGFLTLPSSVIRSLGLSSEGEVSVQLADGSITRMDVYIALLRWGDIELPVRINAADTDPLIGMALLSGHELRIAVRPNGAVAIKKL
jgi:clan AA aspartic protease